MSFSQPLSLGATNDGSAIMFYGSGVRGANATDAGDPASNFGITANNGDTLTYSSINTSSGSSTSYDSQTIYSRAGSEGESVAYDRNSGLFDAVDNGNKYTTDAQGNIDELSSSGSSTSIGNLSDTNIQSELTQNGMTSQAASDFVAAAKGGSINDISGVHDDFSNSDLREFNQVKHQTQQNQIKNENFDQSTGSSSSAAPDPLLASIMKLLGD